MDVSAHLKHSIPGKGSASFTLSPGHPVSKQEIIQLSGEWL